MWNVKIYMLLWVYMTHEPISIYLILQIDHKQFLKTSLMYQTVKSLMHSIRLFLSFSSIIYGMINIKV